MRHSLLVPTLALAGLVLSGAAAAQQSPDGPSLPTCASQGIQRVAVMVPPGQTAAQLQETLRRGSLFPAGTEVRILQPGQLMPIRNREEFDARLHTTLTMFLNDGITIQGTARMLVEVDDEGVVTAVHPNSGDPEVNRILVRTWRQARFEPYVFEGCRVKAWIQVPQTFATGSSGDWRQMEVRTDAPKP
jgi:hypothetical protein